MGGYIQCSSVRVLVCMECSHIPLTPCPCSQICENVALVLTAYQVLINWDLRSLIYMGASCFGARMLAVLLVYGLMSLR